MEERGENEEGMFEEGLGWQAALGVVSASASVCSKGFFELNYSDVDNVSRCYPKHNFVTNVRFIFRYISHPAIYYCVKVKPSHSAQIQITL